MTAKKRYCKREYFANIWQKMTRTKGISEDVLKTPLSRCLSTFDITLLGIGHMVGAGIYVLVGTVAKDTAGPAIVISLIFAGFASVLSALCYAEFGAQVPKAGSAYVYTYVTIGEFWAFVIGWNIILEHMIGAASVSRAWSGYVNSLFNGALSNATETYIGSFHQTFLAPYPDPIAFFVTIAFCILLTMGVKGASYFNSFFTLVNLCVITFVISVGLFRADLKNWQTEGGFAPYGFSGIMAGAASSFYAYVGFDSIATSGEEAIDPAKSIPIATFVSMALVAVGYILVSAVLTLMVPYYDLNPAAALPDAFSAAGLHWAKYIISIGALCGMTTTLFGGLFSLPRCVYSMASDGLLFPYLAKVSTSTQVPVINMVICSIITAVIAMMFDIEKLVEFMSIGTLLAYTIVSASVIILRYRTRSITINSSETDLSSKEKEKLEFEDSKSYEQFDSDSSVMIKPFFSKYFSYLPKSYHSYAISISLIVFSLCVTILAALLQWGSHFLQHPVQPWAVLVIIILLIGITLSVVTIAAHKEVSMDLSFKVPLVPYIPLLSMCLNIVLMLHLNPMTWLRFLIWMAIGLAVYFFYGIHNSKEALPVNDYTTLLAESNLQGERALENVQRKFSEVTSKLMSTASEATKGKLNAQESDTENIIEEEQPSTDHLNN